MEASSPCNGNHFLVYDCNGKMSIHIGSFSVLCSGYIYMYVYVTGSGKRYTNAHAMIFLYKRCCSKTRNIFYSLKKNFFGA